MKNNHQTKINKVQAGKKKVVVIEDDPGISEIIKIILEEQEYQVTIQNQGKNVREVIKKDPPSLILLDLWMSGMDGPEIIKLLRSDSSTRKIPIIVISALSEGAVVARQAGADGFLAKPFNISDLIKIVDKFISA